MGRDIGVYKRNCDEQVHNGPPSVSFHQCTRTGVVQRVGRWYCRQHDPEKVNARQRERDNKNAKEWALKQKKWALEALDNQLLRRLLRTECWKSCDLVVSQWKEKRKKLEEKAI